MSKLNDYPRPSVTVDLVIFTIAEDDLKVLLIRRGQEPFKGRWALPGGFVEIDESLERAAARELKEEVGVTNVYLEQLYTFGEPRRDPRGRVISVSYFALVDAERQRIVAASDAAEAQWRSVFDAPKLAFDHARILDTAVWRLRNKIEWTTVGYELLPKKFTLSELQRVYEIILQRPVDKRNFRKKILAQGQIIELNESRSDVAHRPARLYSFRKQ
ncbi:MAG TPA: NUDIX domain-containing protein [Blastocatellia bacterium]|jgi:8-oxo-dGTP diphosphatase|nr:NUDIX domain-containing protein [Blastocatellia bacterium]